MTKKIIAIMLCLCAVFCLFGCGKTETTAGDGTTDSDYTLNNQNIFTEPMKSKDPVKVEMTVRDFGKITLELYPEIAPVTVNNFVTLAKDGFYDGLTFHRVYKGFMIQGGDPLGNGNGTGGAEQDILGEFMLNGIENNLSHERGVISMARSQNYNSASSQFFICHADSTHLDGQYAAFGKVLEGMEVVDKIADIEVAYSLGGEKTAPVNPVYIDQVKVID